MVVAVDSVADCIRWSSNCLSCDVFMYTAAWLDDSYHCCCSMQVSIFTDTILLCLVPTSLVHHNWYCLPPSSITNARTLFLVFGLPQPFFSCIRPSNVILSNELCLRIWPNHLFCRLLRVSIISLSVSTICNTSSFVLCSVHDTFIIRLHIHISNASSYHKKSFGSRVFITKTECDIDEFRSSLSW